MTKLFSLPLFLLLAFVACESAPEGKGESYDGDDFEIMADMPVSLQPPPPPRDMVYAEEAMEVAPAGGPSGKTSVSQPLPNPADTVAKQIIKTASLVYEVKNLPQVNQKVDSLVKRSSGYISSSNQHNSQRRHELNLVLWVPSRHFDGLMQALSTLPERIDHKSVEAQDVTEQYVDLRSRLQTKKKVEKRYQELLQKANTVKEILEVEDKLRYLQEEIEAKEGQLRYLTHQVGYSTIQLNLYEVQAYEYLPSRAPHFGQQILSALDGGWQMLLGLVLLLFRLWPLLLLLALVVFLLKKYRSRKSGTQING